MKLVFAIWVRVPPSTLMPAFASSVAAIRTCSPENATSAVPLSTVLTMSSSVA